MRPAIRGEFVHLASRIIAYAKLIENDTPKSQRVFYGFTNLNCSVPLNRMYPDFCRDTKPKDVSDFLEADITFHLIWLTVAHVLHAKATLGFQKDARNLDECLDSDLNKIYFLKIHTPNISDDFPKVLRGQCSLAGTTSTTAAPLRDGGTPIILSTL